MKNIAIILAGGTGQRMGSNVPKQLLIVGGKSVLEHTLDIFESHQLIDEIAIVCHVDLLADVQQIVARGDYAKVKKVLRGGNERCYSTLAAIEAYHEEVNMLFHDAVRPLVSERIITDCVLALEKYNAIGVAIPTTDTILQVNERNEIERIPSRVHLRNAQTPQGFKRSVIKRAYDIALKDTNFKATDDCGVVLTYLPDEPIHVVQGEPSNIKLTYQEDFLLLEHLLTRKTNK